MNDEQQTTNVVEYPVQQLENILGILEWITIHS
jgi:hypothetical protein